MWGLNCSLIVAEWHLYGVVCVQLAKFSIGDWKDISIAHVIIIIKSEVFTIVFIFFRGCVSQMFVTLYSVTYCIYTRETREFAFIIIVQFVMSANNRIHFVLKIVFVCLYITPSHYHHWANLSEDIERTKCLSDIFWRVCEWDKAYSRSYQLYNMWGCVFSVYPFHLWWLQNVYIICLSIIIKSKVWTITHCLGLGHETMVCAVCFNSLRPSDAYMRQWTIHHCFR